MPSEKVPNMYLAIVKDDDETECEYSTTNVPSFTYLSPSQCQIMYPNSTVINHDQTDIENEKYTGTVLFSCLIQIVHKRVCNIPYVLKYYNFNKN